MKEGLNLLKEKGVFTSYKENDNFVSIDILMKNNIFYQIVIENEDVLAICGRYEEDPIYTGYRILGKISCNLEELANLEIGKMKYYVLNDFFKNEEELLEYLISALFNDNWELTEGEIMPHPNGGRRFLSERDRSFVESMANVVNEFNKLVKK